MHTPWPLLFASGNSFLEIEMRCGEAVLPPAGKAVGSRLQKFTESVNFCKCKGCSKPAFPEPRRDLAVGFEGRKNSFPEAFCFDGRRRTRGRANYGHVPFVSPFNPLDVGSTTSAEFPDATICATD